MLKLKLSAMSYVGGINIFDADGTLINSSSVWPVPRSASRTGPISRPSRADPRSPDMLIELVHSRITGVWTTVIARKVTGPNGEFLGVVGRGIEPPISKSSSRAVALGDDAAISMFHRDGTLLARYPHVDAMIGQNFEPRPALRLAASSARTSASPCADQSRSTARTGSARRACRDEFPIVDRRDHDGVGGAGRLARANPVSDRRRPGFRRW